MRAVWIVAARWSATEVVAADELLSSAGGERALLRFAIANDLGCSAWGMARAWRYRTAYHRAQR